MMSDEFTIHLDDNMDFLSLEQFLSLGKKCSHCDKKAKWLAHPESPAYCDEHFPYWEEKIKEISCIDNNSENKIK